MEEQYGERYIMKLEERLLHYLEELDKALPQPTYIDQVRQGARQCVCVSQVWNSHLCPFLSYVEYAT